MTDEASGVRFNVLTDPWLPLAQAGGATCWASVAEVLCGEKDGCDLDYPRDDFRVYARLLLSAIVQALFAAKDRPELEARIEKPLTRAEYDVRVSPVLDDFDLFGPKPFLQVLPAADPGAGAAPFVFSAPDLYQPSVRVDGVSIPVALVTIFAEETYAGAGGRGYGAGPGGQPGAFTLIDAGTIRRSAWANTLSSDVAQSRYAKDGPCPWSNAVRVGRARASLGLVEGLFFQPRGIWLTPVAPGVCSVIGIAAPLVRVSPLLPKSSLAKKPTSGEDVWPHPCAPLAVNSLGIAPVRLNAARPAWTGLAQLLEPLSKASGRPKHPLEGPALVLSEWKKLKASRAGSRLLVLDFDRDKSIVRQRFFEAFPLTHDLLDKPEVVERLRALADETQDIAWALERALLRAHDDRKQGGLALGDARSTFWAATEAPFWTWLDAALNADLSTDPGWEQIETAHREMSAALRRVAVTVFDAHAEMSEFDPRKQERVAKARRGLQRALRPDAPGRPFPKPDEVTA